MPKTEDYDHRDFPDDREEMTKDELKVSILLDLGYKTTWSYIPKDALNSLWAYITGEFVYNWEDGDLMSRHDMMLTVGSMVDEYEFNDQMTRDQLLKLRELMDEVGDQRRWT